MKALLNSSLALCFMFAGCSLRDDRTDTSDGPSTHGESPVSTDTAIQQISANWSEAESWVPRITAVHKKGEEYRKARSLYDVARRENNSWVELLVTKIKAGEKPEKSKEFQAQSQKAAESSHQFLEYAKGLQDDSSRIAIAAVAPLVDLLVTNGFKIWTEYHKQRQADRDRKADDLRKRLLWPTWEKAS